ncbi:M48 family metalloprotease [Sphingopyxis sp. MWB1]|uniref:M48 family metalloprotease n=1 Tax=Sphingopyxis sp. MWB1 TaxID=1537715 RepID=UPI00051A332C|nr:M48 family metalloprotease [Sphingopyxis sp. MWB1]
MLHRLFLLPLLALIAGAALPRPAMARDIAEWAEQEARLAAVGHRLATGSAAWCPRLTPQSGWLLSDLRRFNRRDRAEAAHYGPPDAPFAAAVAPGSAAARAGLRVGAGIAAINGAPVAAAGEGETDRIDTVILMVEALNPAEPMVVTDEAGATYRLDPSPGCASAFRIEDNGPQAAANGMLVRVHRKLARKIDDDALAVVVAHELAHNILHHRARLGDNRSSARVRATEVEADRLGVWLLGDAGYDPRIAISFWQTYKGPLFRAATHPPHRERIRVIEEEIEARAAARRADPTAKPPLIIATPPLE